MLAIYKAILLIAAWIFLPINSVLSWDKIIEGDLYSDLYLTVPNNPAVNGTSLLPQAYEMGISQQFRVEDDGLQKIIHTVDETAPKLVDFHAQPGDIIQWQDYGSNTKKWNLALKNITTTSFSPYYSVTDSTTDRDSDGLQGNSDPSQLDPENDTANALHQPHIDNCLDTSSNPQEDGNNNGLGDDCGPSHHTKANSPRGISFDNNTLERIGYTGDNWCQTWTANNTVITAMDDGDWLGTHKPPVYHSRLYEITGGSDSVTVTDMPGYPSFLRGGDGWFAYGINAVNGVLYSFVSKTQGEEWSEGPFRGMKLLRSYDSGSTWYRVDQYDNDRYLSPTDLASQLYTPEEMFFFEESGRVGKGKMAYPFSYAAFVQNGQDHSASQDGYVYIYSPEGAESHELLLARVPENQVGQKSEWEYFSGWSNGAADWSSDIEARQPNITFPETNSSGDHFGWYSWLPSVVWNEGLQLYVMANGGTYAGNNQSNSTNDYYHRWMHSKSGSLGFWYSENPYGPWTQFYYDDEWTVDSVDNLTYQPKLSPKWMSADGSKMTLIWSDAMRDAEGFSHSVNYKWNQIEIDIQLTDDPAEAPLEPPVTASTGRTPDFIANLQKVDTGLCVGIVNASQESGENADSVPCDENATNQRIRFFKTANTIATYSLQFAHSDQCLSIPDNNSSNGVSLVQHACNFIAPAQQFEIKEQGGNLTLLTGTSNNVVDSHAQTDDIIQWQANGDDNQKWSLVLQNTTSPTEPTSDLSDSTSSTDSDGNDLHGSNDNTPPVTVISTPTASQTLGATQYISGSATDSGDSGFESGSVKIAIRDLSTSHWYNFSNNSFDQSGAWRSTSASLFNTSTNYTD